MHGIFPPFRHVVIIDSDGKRSPAKVLVETPTTFNTPRGMFDKQTRRQWGRPEVTFEGPFTAEGDMENRP